MRAPVGREGECSDCKAPVGLEGECSDNRAPVGLEGECSTCWDDVGLSGGLFHLALAASRAALLRLHLLYPGGWWFGAMDIKCTINDTNSAGDRRNTKVTNLQSGC